MGAHYKEQPSVQSMPRGPSPELDAEASSTPGGSLGCWKHWKAQAEERGPFLPSMLRPCPRFWGEAMKLCHLCGRDHTELRAHSCFPLAVKLKPSFQRQAESRVFSREWLALGKVKLKVPYLGGKKPVIPEPSLELEEPRPGRGLARGPAAPRWSRCPSP